MSRKKKSGTKQETPPTIIEQKMEAVDETKQPDQTGQDFPIVGIGASAGGLAAFEKFFSAMPAKSESGMAFVLVQHLSPDHKSILTELVKRYTPMQVYEVEDGMKVEPNCTYIIPPNRDMAILNGVLRLLEPNAPRGVRLPIDFFFRSLAQDQHERAICIVLSGTGTDGTLGVRAVKGEGGIVLVQSPESTSYDGMPRSAIATGLVDDILPPADMPARLIAYVSHAFGRRTIHVAPPTPKLEDTLQKICILIRAQTGHDFSQYKQNTLIRRVERRMALAQLEQMDDYLRYLQNSTVELEALFRDMLIGVTSFFRDPEAFQVLETQVIPRLFNNKPIGADIRVWVCGCSTGEEAYSLAILVQEQMETLKLTFKVQIFATDIDQQAIEQARSGVFPGSIAADITPERLARFFALDEDSNTYRVQKSVRDLLVFSEQNVIKDPPFSKLDLISCRNLLIYMNGDLQKRLIPLFHYALNPEGVLFLGASETVGEHTNAFQPLDRKWKIYLRQEDLSGASRLPLGEFVPPLARGTVAHERPSDGHPNKQVNLQGIIQKALLDYYGSVGALVNERGEILHIYGRTGKFLEPAPGDAAMNIMAMARSGLQRELTAALRQAVTERKPVHFHGLRVRTNGDTILANLAVQPVAFKEGSGLLSDIYLVVLEEQPELSEDDADISADDAPFSSEAQARIAALELELRGKEDYLQTTIEELETSNEELKSANEELQSVNEELQSTNEELETSKEELQSVNEELATVNTELQSNISELSRTNNDMNNLLAGTGVATLFVDMQQHIVRFTPAATQLINFIQTDIGRPVGHIVSNLVNYNTLVEDIQTVLDTLVPKEFEVRTQAGDVYMMRIRPYRTLDNVIEGAVITSIDITERKQAEESLFVSKKQVEGYLDAIMQLINLGALFMENGDRQAILDAIVKTAVTIAGADMGNMQLFDPNSNSLKIVAQIGFESEFLQFWDSVSEGNGACGTALERQERIVVEDVTTSPVFVGTQALEVQLKAGVQAVQSTPLIGRSGQVLGVLSTHTKTPHKPDATTLHLIDLVARQTTDILERAQSEDLLQKSKAETTSYYDDLPIGLAVLDVNLRYIHINNRLAVINGIPAADHIGKTIQEMVPAQAEQAQKLAADILKTGEPVTDIEFQGETAVQPGVQKTWQAGWYPLKDNDGQVIGFSVIVQENTDS